MQLVLHTFTCALTLRILGAPVAKTYKEP